MNKKKVISEILFILLFSLTPFFWLQNNSAVLGHDSGFRLDYWSYFKTLFYSWNYIYNFGVDFSLFKGFLINQLPEFLIFQLTNSLVFTQKITFVMWFFVIGISMYMFCYGFFKSQKYRFMRLYAAIFYMFNFFLLQGWFISERAKFSLFAALPLGLLVLYKTLTKQYSILKGGILFAIIHFLLNGGGIPSLFGALVVSYLTIYIFMTYTEFRKDGKRALLYSIKVAAVFFGLTFLLNAYWTFPLVNLYLTQYSAAISSTGGIEGILDWEAMVNRYASYLHLIRLQGIPDWYDSPLHAYSNYFILNPILIVLSFIPILIITAGLMGFKKKDENKYNRRLIFSILILFFVGLLFTAGSHPPFGFIYVALIKYIPGFAIFRSAFYKFAPAFWFSMIFLSAYYLQHLMNTRINNLKLRVLVGFVIVAGLAVYHFPYFNPTFFNWHPYYSTRIEVPEYVYQTTEYINQNIESDSRFLLLPKISSAHNADMYIWKYWSLDILPRQIIDRSILTNDTAQLPVINAIYSAIDNQNAALIKSLFINSGTDYVLFRKDISDDDGNLQRKLIEADLNYLTSSSLFTKEAEYGEWAIFRFNNSADRKLSIPTRIYEADADKSSIGLIINNTSEGGSILFSDYDRKLLNPHLRITQAKICELCNPKRFNEHKNSVHLPPVQLYPDSRFYFLTEKKEQELLQKSITPQHSIDAQLIILGKRIQEEIRLREYNVDFYIEYKSKLTDEIKNALAGIRQHFMSLSEEDQFSYTYRLLVYYEKYNEYLSALQHEGFYHSGGDLPSKKLMEQEINFLKGSKYYTQADKNNEIAYINADTDKKGKLIYDDIHVSEVLNESQELNNRSELTLQKGLNVFTVLLNNNENVSKPAVLFFEKLGELHYENPVISYTQINPAEYQVTVKGAENSYILQLNEMYNGGWEIQNAINLNMLDLIFDAPQINAKHIEIDGYQNGWIINQKGDYVLTLTYRPYSVFEIGLAVSVVTLLVLVLTYTYTYLWKWKKN